MSEAFGFGDRLRYYRKLRKLTETELARLSGIPRGTLHSYEVHAARRPNIDHLYALARALDVAPEELAGQGPQIQSAEAILASYLRLRPRSIPVYRELPIGGRPMPDIVGYVYTTSEEVGEHAHGLLVEDDWLTPEIQKGDAVVVDLSRSPELGDIVAFKSKGRLQLGRVVDSEDGPVCSNHTVAVPVRRCEVQGVVTQLLRRLARRKST